MRGGTQKEDDATMLEGSATGMILACRRLLVA
jgi:hypothetical protein